MQCTLHSLHCNVHIVHYTLPYEDCTLQIVLSTLHPAHCIVHIALFIINCAQYIGHISTVHIAICSLHCAQYMAVSKVHCVHFTVPIAMCPVRCVDCSGGRGVVKCHPCVPLRKLFHTTQDSSRTHLMKSMQANPFIFN